MRKGRLRFAARCLGGVNRLPVVRGAGRRKHVLPCGRDRRRDLRGSAGRIDQRGGIPGAGRSLSGRVRGRVHLFLSDLYSAEIMYQVLFGMLSRCASIHFLPSLDAKSSFIRTNSKLDFHVGRGQHERSMGIT